LHGSGDAIRAKLDAYDADRLAQEWPTEATSE
jgi:hypothetical protein